MPSDLAVRESLYRELAKRLHAFAECLVAGGEGHAMVRTAALCLEDEANRMSLSCAIDRPWSDDRLAAAAPDLLRAVKALLEDARLGNGGMLPDDPIHRLAAEVVDQVENG